MPNYAVLSGNTIDNVIVADSRDVAEAVTGRPVIQTTGEPWIGWMLIDDVWTRPEDIPQTEPDTE